MAGRKSSASNIKMPDVNALFGLEDSNGKTEAKVVEIALDQLYSFDSHPFRVLDDEKMQETVESIREHGVICPLIVRPGKERFSKLEYSHIAYVLGCLQENTSKVGNIRSYLLTSLYNAALTMDNYYRAEVNHDLYGSG